LKGGLEKMNLKLNAKVIAATSALASVVMTVPVLANGYDYNYTYGAASDAAAATAGLGFSVVWLCCVCIVPLVVGGILAYVVYNDAKKNNVENAALWAVITFFFSVIGLLVYYLAIKPEAMKKQSGGLNAAVTDMKEKVEDKVDKMKDNK